MPYQTQRRSFNRTNTNRRPGQSFGGQRRNTGGSRRGPKKDYIHPSRFVQAANPVEREEYVSANKFEDFMVSDIIKANLRNKGFETPSPIQDQAVPVILSGCDLIGIANTGTGKTAAFAIPIINKLMLLPGSRALIMAPTRELAQQIEQECKEIGKGSRLKGAVLIGGASMVPQLRDLRNNPQIVIGTPGRIKDHLERGTLKLADFDTVVLDEVDRMLDMGFINDMTAILSNMSEGRQSLFFSATMDRKVRDLIDRFATDPVSVSVKQGETSENVNQDIVAFQTREDKMLQLHNILLDQNVEKVIVFDDTQRAVERLSNELVERGFKADAIHGGKNQGQRQRALSRFKKSEITVLVATDVAARGIDVADVTHVINYTQPQSYDDYVHRIGRAGRAGKTGHALTFVEA